VSSPRRPTTGCTTTGTTNTTPSHSARLRLRPWGPPRPHPERTIGELVVQRAAVGGRPGL